MGDHESTEEVPEHVKRSSNNGSDIVIRCHSSCHHSIKGEVKHCEVHKVHVPYEFPRGPFKCSQRVEYGTVNYRLCQHVWKLNRTL